MKFNIKNEFIIDQLNKNNFLPGLYIVSTPIGNLADISIRALTILSRSSLILCEDTRTSRKLTSKYGIKNTLKTFHKFNSAKETPKIIRQLKEKQTISIISDAGTPLISDPGDILINQCIINNIAVYSIPGASSVLGSIVISGIDTSKFTFLGFVPQVKKLKEEFIERIIYSNESLIIFESPKRVKKLFEEFSKEIPSRNIALIRELTKKNEEVIRGKAEILYQNLIKRKNIKGEITIIIDGSKKNKENKFNNLEIMALINLYKNKITNKEMVSMLAKKLDISKRVIYQMIIENK